MQSDEFQTIADCSEGFYKEKGSKFIAKAYPVSSEEEVRNILQELRKTFHDARHHCYAYSLGPKRENYRFNDDGEPSGTAGKPIYGQLLSHEITDTLIVVIRYFGGTKLGVSGLIQAYREAAREAIRAATIQMKTVQKEVFLKFEYPMMNEVMRMVKDSGAEISRQHFEWSCEMELAIRASQFDELLSRCESLQGVAVSLPDNDL